MSRFHYPRRGWLPHLFDGLKLVLLGAFLIAYLALLFQPPADRNFDLNAKEEFLENDSSSYSSLDEDS